MNENIRNILNGGYDAFSEKSEDFVVKAYNAYKLRPDKYSDKSGLLISEAFNRIRKKKHEYVPSNAAIETTPQTDQELYEKYSENTEGLDVTNLNIPVGDLSEKRDVEERQLAYYLNNKDSIDSQVKNGAFNLIPDNEFDADDSEEDKSFSRETFRVLRNIEENYNPLDWQDPKRAKELEKEILSSLNVKLSDRVKNNTAFFVDGFVNSVSLGYAPSLIPQEVKEKIPMTTSQTVSSLAGNLFGMLLPAGGISKGVGLGLKTVEGASKPVLAQLMKQFPHFNKLGKLALQNPKSTYVAGSTANLMMREGLTLGLYGQAVKHPKGTELEDRVKEFGSHVLEGTLYGGIGLSSKIAAANKTLRPYEFQAFMAEVPLVGYMSYKMEQSRRPDDVTGAITAAVTNSFLHMLPAYSSGYIKKSELIDEAVKIADVKWGNEIKENAKKGFENLFDEMPPVQKENALEQYKIIRNERFKDTEFDENQGKIKDLTLQERDAIVEKKSKEPLEKTTEDKKIKNMSSEELASKAISKIPKAFPIGLSVKETSKYVKKDGTQVTADEFQNISKEKDFAKEDWMPVDEYIEERGELKSILSEIWNRKKLEGKASYDDFKDAVKELGAGGKIVMSKEIFNDIEQDLRITKVKDLVEDYNEKEFKDPNDPIINTETEANSSNEYVGNILKKKFDSGSDEGVAIQAVLENLFSGTEFKASQGQRGWNEIIGKSLEKPFLAKVIEKIAKRNYSPEKLHMSEQLVALRHTLADALDMMIKNTEPEKAKAFESWFKTVAEANISFTAEAGRLLNTAKIKTGKVNEGKVAKALKELNLNRDVRKMLGDLLENPELIQNPDMKWKFVEWARNAKLASLSSLTRSVVGNAVSHTLHVGDMATAPLYNRLLTKTANKWMGTDYTQSIRAEESLLYFAGVKKGFKPALKTAWDVMRENDMAIQDNSYLRNEGFSDRHIKGKKGLAIRAPQNAQAALDVFHRLPAIHGQLYRYASRAAQEFFHKQGIVPSMSDRIKKINELVENPTSDILQKAYADAEFITFQERPTDILSKHLSHLRKQSAIAQFFVPFQNTPTNIFKQAFYSRSPIGLLHKGFKTAWKIANKRITQEGLNDASTELARATTGTLAQLGLSGLMYKVLEGEVTSSGRDMTDEQRRLAETDHGWMPNSIKLTDKNGASKYYSFEGYEPVASWLSLARSYKENEKNQNWFRSWIKSNEEMAYSFLDNPFVSQIGDISKVMDGRKDWMDFTVDLAVGSIFPNFLRQSSKVINPEKIERPKKPEGYSLTDELRNASLWKRKMAKSIPFSNQLPYLKNANIPKRDIFGEVMLFEDPVGSMFGVRGFLSDTKPEESKVYSEIQRLFWDGDRDLLRTQNYLGDITLSPYIYDALIEYSGKAIKDSLTKVINSPVWEDISREAELNGESGNKAQHDTILKIKNGIYEAQRNLLLQAEKEKDSLTHNLRWGIAGESVPDKEERKQILEDFK